MNREEQQFEEKELDRRKKQLLARQNLPLEVKVELTKERIHRFVDEYGLEGVYIAFSGGMDSTVLLHLCRVACGYGDAFKAMYLDTWMEYPQIREFVRTFQNVDVEKPEKSLKQIIEEDGWCYPGKEVATLIHDYRAGKPYAIKKLHGLDKDGNKSEFRQRYVKWLPLVESKFVFSGRCCQDMKHGPAEKYEKKTGRHPLMALMASEGKQRMNSYLKTGCLTFDSDRPKATPMGFWTKQDVFNYVRVNGLAIASPYGEIYEEGTSVGQMYLPGFEKLETNRKLTCTGEKRTGCLFCPVGCHLDGFIDGEFAKFARLKKYNPSLYEYCMNTLGLRELLDYIRENFVKDK